MVQTSGSASFFLFSLTRFSQTISFVMSINEFICFYDVPRRVLSKKPHLTSIKRDISSGVTKIFSGCGRLCAIVQTKDYKSSIDINIISSNGELVDKSFLKTSHVVKVDPVSGVCFFDFLFTTSSQNLKSVIFHMIVSWQNNNNSMSFLISSPFAAYSKCNVPISIETEIVAYLSVHVVVLNIKNNSTALSCYLITLREEIRGDSLSYFVFRQQYTMEHKKIYLVATNVSHDIISNTHQVLSPQHMAIQSYSHILLLKHSLVKEMDKDVVITISIDPTESMVTTLRHSIGLKRSIAQVEKK
jgi:hypothetical protein